MITLNPEQREIVKRILDGGKRFTDLVKLAGLRPEADFRYAMLRNIDFGQADLTGYDFTGADLTNANLSDVRPPGPVLADAIIEGAKISERFDRIAARTAVAALRAMVHSELDFPAPKSVAVRSSRAFYASKDTAEENSTEESGARGIRSFANYRIHLAEYLGALLSELNSANTLIEPAKIRNLKEISVEIDLERGGRKYPERGFLAKALSLKAVLIVGLPGIGKTMLLKRLSVALAVDQSCPIPLFFEARLANALIEPTSLDLLLHARCFRDSNVAPRHFRSGLKRGFFCLILDGLDELDAERRGLFFRMLVKFRKTFPKVTVICSSRYMDDDQRALSEFHIFKICPLGETQTAALLRKLSKEQNRIIRSLRRSEYSTVMGMLSNPLLAQMVCLSFDLSARPPRKRVMALEMAFDSLFFKHDASKVGYIRKRATGLPIDEFKKFLSAFCFNSIIQERFFFTSEDLDSEIEAAKRLASISASSSGLKADMLGVVLTLEGRGHIFVHRVFQEYFAACFLVAGIAEDVKSLVDKICRGPLNEVLRFACEINPDVIQIDWALPTLRNLIRVAAEAEATRECSIYLQELYDEVYLHPSDQKLIVVAPKLLGSARQILLDVVAGTKSWKRMLSDRDYHRRLVRSTIGLGHLRLSKKDNHRLSETWVPDWIRQELTALTKLEQQFSAKSDVVNPSLQRMLGRG